MPQRQIERSDSSACAVLVLSCDRYQDLWVPFFTLFQRHWPDCRMPVHLGTNCARMDLDWVCTLQAGNDEAWSRRLRVFLESIQAEYVLLMLEDFFLDRDVSNEAVDAELHLLQSLQGASLRLFPNTPPDYFRNGIGVLHAGADFRVSLQATIWNRMHLLSLLVDEESPWDFELNGTERSRGHASGFYCVAEPVIHYRHVVERGEWFRSEARYYSSQDIGCNFQARPTMGILKTGKKIPLNYMRRSMTKLQSWWLRTARGEKVFGGR